MICAVALELDWLTLAGVVVLAALVALAIWAPGPLRPYRGALIAGILALAGFVVGRATKTRSSSDDAARSDDETAPAPDSGPTENKAITDALNASDELLRDNAHETPADRPFADLSDDALRRALESATGTEPE